MTMHHYSLSLTEETKKLYYSGKEETKLGVILVVLLSVDYRADF